MTTKKLLKNVALPVFQMRPKGAKMDVSVICTWIVYFSSDFDGVF